MPNYWKIVIKIIGFIVLCGSVAGICKAVGICQTHEKYKHMEYNQITEVNYLIDRTIEIDANNRSEYWTIGCVYKLKPSMYGYIKESLTEVKVWVDHKFPTKYLAVEHLYCAGEDKNSVKDKLPLYYPTKGYVFNISLSGKHLNNKCYHYDQIDGMNHWSEIVFDRYVVYGTDSNDYYNSYTKERTYYCFVFVILLICSPFGFCTGVVLFKEPLQ